MQQVEVEEIKYDVKGKSFEKLVEEMTESTKDKTIEEKNFMINELCEVYVMHYGKAPDSWQLQLLANIILHEDLSNPAPNKMRKEEFPFHSNAQRKRRNRKEFVTMDDTLDFMNHKRKTNASTAPPRDITL